MATEWNVPASRRHRRCTRPVILVRSLGTGRGRAFEWMIPEAERASVMSLRVTSEAGDRMDSVATLLARLRDSGVAEVQPAADPG